MIPRILKSKLSNGEYKTMGGKMYNSVKTNNNDRSGNGRPFHGRVYLFFLAAACFVFLWWALPAPAAPAKNSKLFDLQGHWARGQVTKLVAMDIVKGYSDGTFRPDQTVSRLEALVLILRSCGMAAEAESQSQALKAQGGTRTAKGAAPDRGKSASRHPWGQPYIDLAEKNGFLPEGGDADFDYNGPATRIEVVKLLARVLYLVPPAKPGAEKTAEETAAGAGRAGGTDFSDISDLNYADRAYLNMVAGLKAIDGYPDGSFRPLETITRAELMVILNRLIDQGWVKAPAGKRLEGWISRIAKNQKQQQLDLTSLSGTQKYNVSNSIVCFRGGNEYPLEQALNFRCEIVLDGSRQVAWVNLLEEKIPPGKTEIIRGSVKIVALGRENLIILSDLGCRDRILRLSWDAILAGKKAPRDFKSLRAGVFVDVELSDGLARKVTSLETYTVSGTVSELSGARLYLKEGLTGVKKIWFDHWDNARVVDKNGVYTAGPVVGDQVKITYLDPLPKELDDEIPLEIMIS